MWCIARKDDFDSNHSNYWYFADNCVWIRLEIGWRRISLRFPVNILGKETYECLFHGLPCVGDSSKDHWWKILVDYHDTSEKCRVSVTGKIILCAGANMQLVYLITFLTYMFTGCHLPQRKHILDRQWIINDKKLKNCWLLHVKRIRVFKKY